MGPVIQLIRSGSLRDRFVLNAAMTLVLSISIAALGLWITISLSTALQHAGVMASALRNHSVADMMHDTLRGDVLAAVQAGAWGLKTDQDDVRMALTEHIKTFEYHIAANKKLDLPDDVMELLTKAEGPLSRYVASAEDMVDIALEDHEYARMQMPGFQATYADLSDAMLAAAMVIESRLSEANEASTGLARNGQIAMVVALLAGVILGVGMNMMTARAVIPPLRKMTDTMTRLAAGDTAVDIPDENRRDEMGQMAKAVATFRENAIARVELEEKQKAESAAREKRAAVIDELTSSFDEKMRHVLNVFTNSTGELDRTAQSMAEVARRTSTRASTVRTAAEETKDNTQAVASATTELSASISEVGRQVGESTKVSSTAVDQATKTHETVSSMAEAADKIGEVAKLIADIAAQTNLLALNATIEAARAGDAGKGFAVVASEVKSLANQTAKATEDISAQIAAIQGASRASVDAISQINQTIVELNEINTAVATAVEQQDSATQEIARNVEQAAGGTEKIAENIIEVTDATSETQMAGEEVLQASRMLGQQSGELSTEVDEFLRQIKAV